MKSRAAVVLCSDQNWVWQSAFQLRTALNKDPDGILDYHAYLIGDFSLDFLELFDPRVKVTTIRNYPRDFAFETQMHVPKGSMLRLFAIQDLARKYDRLIYMDGDVFIDRGHPADFLKIPLTNSPLCAVRNRSHWPDNQRDRYNQRYIDKLSSKIGERYFNSGVLIVNTRRWLEEEISRRALDFFISESSKCKFGDQSALNYVLAGSWSELSPGWNWQMSKLTYPLTEGRRPRLVHFTGPLKPWNDRLRLLPPRFFASMEAFLSAHGRTDLLGNGTPTHYQRENERERCRRMEAWSDSALEKREKIKGFLDRTDFFDLQAGVVSFDC